MSLPARVTGGTGPGGPAENVALHEYPWRIFAGGISIFDTRPFVTYLLSRLIQRLFATSSSAYWAPRQWQTGREAGTQSHGSLREIARLPKGRPTQLLTQREVSSCAPYHHRPACSTLCKCFGDFGPLRKAPPKTPMLLQLRSRSRRRIRPAREKPPGKPSPPRRRNDRSS